MAPKRVPTTDDIAAKSGNFKAHARLIPSPNHLTRDGDSTVLAGMKPRKVTEIRVGLTVGTSEMVDLSDNQLCIGKVRVQEQTKAVNAVKSRVESSAKKSLSGGQDGISTGQKHEALKNDTNFNDDRGTYHISYI